jgi:uncharacterized repeat protein (TIGR04042 family)
MPEMRFHIRWPDGTRDSCYSPSLVIMDYFSVGAEYALPDFLERSRTALGIASERVRVKYGVPCRRALAQLAHIEAAADAFAESRDARVAVEAFDDMNGGSP